MFCATSIRGSRHWQIIFVLFLHTIFGRYAIFVDWSQGFHQQPTSLSNINHDGSDHFCIGRSIFRDKWCPHQHQTSAARTVELSVTHHWTMSQCQVCSRGLYFRRCGGILEKCRFLLEMFVALEKMAASRIEGTLVYVLLNIVEWRYINIMCMM